MIYNIFSSFHFLNDARTILRAYYYYKQIVFLFESFEKREEIQIYRSNSTKS